LDRDAAPLDQRAAMAFAGVVGLATTRRGESRRILENAAKSELSSSWRTGTASVDIGRSRRSRKALLSAIPPLHAARHLSRLGRSAAWDLDALSSSSSARAASLGVAGTNAVAMVQLVGSCAWSTSTGLAAAVRGPMGDGATTSESSGSEVARGITAASA